MKRTQLGTIGLLALAGLLTATAAAQSLGDYARQQRAKKGPAPADVKEYTNDNLPTSGGLSTIGALNAAPAPTSSGVTAKGNADATSDKDMAKLETEWRGKFSKQKSDIALLQRELDLAVGDQKLMVANFHRAPAENMQRSRTFAEDNQKSQAQIADKKQAVADAQQKLDDMREELRKTGLPNSWAD